MRALESVRWDSNKFKFYKINTKILTWYHLNKLLEGLNWLMRADYISTNTDCFHIQKLALTEN